ncbi:DUF6443 domain-containing protein [Runella sp.]|uniref:DUF6443 domain-containing protein n=1 Tax=Runella sp. TaxID=1960881 RepID=UPI003D09BA78
MKNSYTFFLLFLPLSALAQISVFRSDTLKKPSKDTTLPAVETAPDQLLRGLSVASPNVAGLGKFADIPVNFNNGLPQISIPIAIVSEGNVQLPISLQYHTGGVRVSDVASWVGLNWVLNAGGVISRQVRGGPDESWSGGNKGSVPATAYYGTLTGYYQNYGYPTFPVVAGSTSSTDALRASDQLLAAALGINDTEPDLFNYNLGGLTGKFFFDAQRKPHFIPQQDITVEVIFNAVTYQFDTFILTTPNGTRYYFGQNNAFEVSKTATGTSILAGTAAFRSAWYLTQIESADRQKHIYLTYTPETTTFRNINGEKRIFCTTDNAYNGPASNERISTTEITGQRLLKIYSRQQEVNFGANTTREDVEGDSKRLDHIEVSAIGDAGSCLRFNLTYDYFQSAATPEIDMAAGVGGDAGTTDLKRLRLLSIQEKSCNNTLTKPAYSFAYESTALPRRLSYQRDHWGYYNGQSQNNSLIPPDQAATTLTNGNRTPNWAFMQAAHLQKITYPTGGYTLFTFEPHYETNPLTYKGGLRIQKIEDFAATGVAETRTFTYNSPFEAFPATSYRRTINSSEWGMFVQSGLPLTGALQTFNASCLQNSPSLAGSDLYSDIAAMGGSAIAYGRVSVARAGGGRSDYYYLAAGYTSTFSSISAGVYPIPASSALYYAVNGKLDHEEHYNESGRIQRKTEYTYQSLTGTPALTNAPAIQLVQDVCPLCAQVPNQSTVSVAFTAYNLYEYRLLLLEKKEYQYNFDGTQELSLPTRYRYTANHTQPIRTATVDSKGDSLITTSRFVLDYDLSGSLSGTAAVLKTMKDRNQNAEIERLTYLKKAGETDATMLATGGTLTHYGSFLVGSNFLAALPSAVWILKVPQRMSVNPSYVAGDIVFDNQYERRAAFTYNGLAELSEEQLERGPVTHYEYYANHLLQSSTQAYGSNQSQYTSYVHNSLFGLTQTTHPRGVQSSYEYDALGRLLHRKDHQGNIVQAYRYGYAPNVVKQYVPRVASASLPEDYTQRVGQFAYVDGLGRPLQTVLHRAAGDASADIVTNAQTYDLIGRPKRTYLPFAYAGDGALAPLPGSVQGDAYPYTEHQDFDGSPFDRIRTTYGPGQAWRTAGRLTDTQYGLGGAQARRYELTPTGAAATGGYAFYTLTENLTIDEQGHYTAVYTDKQGRVVQRSTQKDVTAGGAPTFYYTAYVYDELGRLRYVVPPKAHEAQTGFVEDSDYFREGIYAYRYDARGRITEKHLPGAGWAYTVYDVLDRPVLTQDENERLQNQWQFTQYDIHGRVCRTGVLTNTADRSTLQAQFDNIPTPYETAGTSSFPFAITAGDLQTENYYDTYDAWRPADHAYTAQGGYGGDFGNATGLLTGKKVRYLENNTFLTGTFYYDDKARMVQSHQQNHLGGTDRVDNAYLHAGEIEKTQTTHNRSGASNQVTRHRYLYDHIGRKTTYFHSLNGVEKEIANYRYNERGQLIQKKIQPTGTYQTTGTGLSAIARPANPAPAATDEATRQIELTNGTLINAAQLGSYLAQIVPGGGTGTTDALQTIDYDYHLRGWLTGINAPNGVASLNAAQNDLFALSLQYENDGTYFDGSLRKQLWLTQSPAQPLAARHFTYTYNHANRLTGAKYGGGKEDFSLDKAEYDANGNLTQLWRNGLKNNGLYGRTDDLQYTYPNYSNKPQSVTDISGEPAGFQDNPNNQDYTYWPDGNLKTDANKGIENISYNFIDLVAEIQLSGSRWVGYHYDATGTKRKKVTSTGKTVDYVGEYIYENNALYQIAHDEGRIVPSGSNFVYEYNYTDQLGNLRLSFRDSLTAGAPPVVTQESHLGPWGETLSALSYQNVPQRNFFDFTNHERQTDFNLEIIDAKARMYDPLVPRMWGIDPLAEKFYAWSPYNYAFNNPVRFIDPTGMGPDDPITHTIKKGETLTSISKQYGVSIQDLASLNGLQNADKIRAGTTLKVNPEMDFSNNPHGGYQNSNNSTGEVVSMNNIANVGVGFVVGAGSENVVVAGGKALESVRNWDKVKDLVSAGTTALTADGKLSKGETFSGSYSPGSLMSYLGRVLIGEEKLVSPVHVVGSFGFSMRVNADGNTATIAVYDSKTNSSFSDHKLGTSSDRARDPSKSGNQPLTTQYFRFIWNQSIK